MFFVQSVLAIAFWTGNLNFQAANEHPKVQLSPDHLPSLYIVAAGPQSKKFVQQMQLLNEQFATVASMHLKVYLDTTSFLTMGWPPGLSMTTPDQQTREAITKRFGTIEGKHEMLIVLVDDRGHVKLTSYDPVTVERISKTLRR